RRTTWAQRRRAGRLARLLKDRAGLALALALTDEVTRIEDPARAARRFADVVRGSGAPPSLGPLDRALLVAGARLAPRLPRLAAALLGRRVRHEARPVVLPAEDPAFARHLARRRAQGIVSNVNVLGEAVLGEEEATRRFQAVLERVRRPDVSYVSVKVSAVCSQLNSLAFDAEVARVADRLGPLYTAAQNQSPPVFLNLDMEEHRDLELTVAVFQRVLEAPGRLGLSAGIVLQAYLPDSHAAADELVAWARDRHQRGGAPVKVRLVKGANLAMERVEAEVRGWPQAPYATKAEVDASYKRLLDVLLAAGDAVRVGVASHNLFDVAWAIVVARAAGALPRIDVEMLEGMAEGEARAVAAALGGLVLYTPIARADDMTSAIAYLVRRLDEGRAPENFLRHLFGLTPVSASFAAQRDRFLDSVADRHHVHARPRHRQDRAAEEAGGRSVEPDAPFVNEPDTDLALPANRTWVTDHLARFATTAPTEVALRVAGRDLLPNLDGCGRDPSAGGRPSYRYARADAGLVDAAVAAARAAQAGWAATPAAERRRLLTGAAEVMARERGRTIAAM
ncbi:MAG: proline dehydrogenase family protein, partial [Acidimicrobiales bacterium]